MKKLLTTRGGFNMTYEQLKNIGVENLLMDASIRNLNVERECFLAKWALAMSWHIANPENRGEELVPAWDNARGAWATNGTVPVWSNLLDLVG